MLKNKIPPDLLKAVDQTIRVVRKPGELEETNHQVPVDQLLKYQIWEDQLLIRVDQLQIQLRLIGPVTKVSDLIWSMIMG